MITYEGAATVPMVYPFVCMKHQPLKLFNVNMCWIGVAIISVGGFFLLTLLLKYSPKAESPLLHLILGYRDLTSVIDKHMVARKRTKGLDLISFILDKQNLVDLEKKYRLSSSTRQGSESEWVYVCSWPAVLVVGGMLM